MEDVPGVIIAGAGPVGLTAAYTLARQGLQATVLEAGPALSTESRASTFHPSSLELLDELGVADQLIEMSQHVPAIQFRDRHSGVVGEFDYGLLADVTRYPLRIQVEQSKLTPILLKQLSHHGDSQVLFNHAVTDVHETDKGMVVTADTADGQRQFRAPVIIGADGAGSMVRKAMGLAFEGETYPERYLVVSTEFDFKAVMPDLAWVNYISDPQQWLALLKTPDHWRATFPIRNDEEAAAAATSDGVQALMQGIHPLEEPYPIVHTQSYNVHRRVAASFSAGLVALAGDAAHLNNPLGGMGMNSGVFDGFFLARRIARSWGDREALAAELEQYASVHKHFAVNVVGAQSNLNWLILRETDARTRRDQQDELRRVTRNPDEARSYLMGASLLAALRQLRESFAAGPPLRQPASNTASSGDS